MAGDTNLDKIQRIPKIFGEEEDKPMWDEKLGRYLTKDEMAKRRNKSLMGKAYENLKKAFTGEGL